MYLQVTKDATQGSEAGKAISIFVLDAFISIDQDKFFLNQLQSRGVLRACLTDIANVAYKVCIIVRNLLNCLAETMHPVCSFDLLQIWHMRSPFDPLLFVFTLFSPSFVNFFKLLIHLCES